MQKFKYRFSEFMRSVYGVDHLNKFLLYTMIGISILMIFIKIPFLSFLYLFILISLTFRMFSRNYSRRYAENQTFLKLRSKVRKPFVNFVQYMKDLPKYKYFKCQRCKTTVRVPRKKGNLLITCPKCRHSFHGRT